ncbi:MAG: hypothetical protein Q9187_001101 [Circinaria calcarea]
MPSHLQTATIQAAVLNVTSSILAQLMTSYRKRHFASSASAVNPLSLQLTPIIQFLIFCLLSTPPNFLWQEYLEREFPGYPVQQGKPKFKLDDEGKSIAVEKRLDIRNTATKFLLDQTLGAATNTALFLVVLELLRGGGLEKCIEVLREDAIDVEEHQIRSV